MPINRSIPGQLHDNEMQAIECLAALVPPGGNIVEVGSLLGRSSWIWAKSAHDSVTVHCIDPWELGGGGNFEKIAVRHSQTFSRKQFLANVQDCPNIRAHQGFSPTDFQHWDQPIDLYFEDSVHTNPILDKNLKFWCSHLKPNGIICGHDYAEAFADVRAAAENLAVEYNRTLQTVGSLWLLLPRSVYDSSDTNVQKVLKTLSGMAVTHNQEPAKIDYLIKLALAQTRAISSFSYEITLDNGEAAISVKPQDILTLTGVMRNAGTDNWPVYLNAECYLEVGAELYIDGQKISVARERVEGPGVVPGQAIPFSLNLPTGQGGVGFCKIDLLYRRLFWFSDRGARGVRVPVKVGSADAEQEQTPATQPQIDVLREKHHVASSHVQAIRALRPVDRFGDRRSGVTEAQFRALCDGAPIWHSIDLGDVFIEGARKTSAVLHKEMLALGSPDFRGKSVLDIGAFGGWFTFEAERRGAAHVTALDYYSWAVSWPDLQRWAAAERAAGRIPDVYHPPAQFIDETRQPGRRVFDLTRQFLASNAEPVLSRVEDYDPERQFDIVLYLGTLYHSENPLASLRKVASLAADHLIVETLGIFCPGQEERPLWEFYHDDQVNKDATTWWAPNGKGLRDILRAVGFNRVDITSSPAYAPGAADGVIRPVRIWAHAWR